MPQKKLSAPVRSFPNRGVFEKASRLVDVGSPLFLNASVDVPPNQSRAPNVLALTHDGLMAVREVRVQAITTYLVADYTSSALYHPGCVLGLSMLHGDRPLTAGPVPVGNLGSPRDHRAEHDFVYVDFTDLSTLTNLLIAEYVWRFNTPLFVPAGTVLAPTFTHFGLDTKTYTINVGYVGWALPSDYRCPRRVEMPWIAAYTPPTITFNGTATLYRSSEKDLVNPFKSTLHVDRLLGRRYMAIAGSTLGFVETPANLESLSLTTCPTPVQLWDSLGNRIVRSDASFNNVFDFCTNSLIVNQDLPPGAYYTVQQKSTTESYENGLIRTNYSVNGWREEVL